MATRQILKVMRTAKQGCPESQLKLGECYIAGGEGLGKNLPTAYQWLAEAADRGSSRAAWLIGEHIPPSAVDCARRAKSYYLKAKELGSTPAATTLARWYLSGMLGTLSRAEEVEQHNILRRAAQAGDLVAQLTIGSMAAEGASEKGDLVWLERAAERGDSCAIRQLIDHHWLHAGGDLWRRGQIPGDKEGGRSEEQMAASKHALFWHEMHWPRLTRDIPSFEMRRRGTLMLMSRQRGACIWLENSAQAGDGIAAYLLGLMYMGPSYLNGLADITRELALPSGRWFPRNYKQAEFWLVRASNCDIAEADFALYILNSLRNYAQRDLREREKRLSRAAQMGHAEGGWLMGCEALEKADIVSAAQWLGGAASQGHSKAIEKLASLAPEFPEPNQHLLHASFLMERANDAFALRLQLGAYFHLRVHEYLLLDPRDADAGDYLLVDVRKSYARGKRRLIKVSSMEQRDVIGRARIRLSTSLPLSGASYKELRRKFLYKCAKLGIHLEEDT